MGGAAMSPQYLDDNGNPVANGASPPKVYLDENGNPLGNGGSQSSQANPDVSVTPHASWFQQLKDNFNANTQGSKPGDGAVKGFIEDIGSGGGDTVRAIAHPIRTLGAMADAAAHPLDEAHAEVDQLRKNPSKFIGNAIGQVGSSAIIGDAVAGPATKAMRATSAKFRPSSSPEIVPIAETQAQKIAQSILPPGGIKPELVKSIKAEAPAIVEYAKRTGNPLNTQAEGLKAAQGVAQEGLDHFNKEILKPIKSDRVSLGKGRSGLGESATLGEISDEISSLNKKVNTAKASNSGEALMMLERGGVQDQLGYLRKVLYDNVSTKTGIPPEDLQTLREGYGGQFTVANGLESAQNARLTRTGQASQGQQNINLKPTSVLELPSKIAQAARGGEQAIADRQFSSAMRGVEPKAPTRPVPNPPNPAPIARNPPIRGESTAHPTFDTTPVKSVTEGNVAARNAAKASAAKENVASANQEFARANELEQGSQAKNAKTGPIVQELAKNNTELKRLQDSEAHLSRLPEHPETSKTLTKVRAQIKSLQFDIDRLHDNLRKELGQR
jgi:hypothetical protein